MTKHIFLYRLKVILRDRELVFWTAAFPIILAALFKIAFGNIAAGETLFPVPVAVVENAQYAENPALHDTLQSLSDGDEPLLTVFSGSLSESEKLLHEEQVDGVIEPGREMLLHVRSSGIRQSILRSFLTQFSQMQSVAETILTLDPALSPELSSEMNEQQNYIRSMALGRREPNQLLVIYFALLAMACFYGGYYGLSEAVDIQADLSTRAARINMAPVHKLKAFVVSLSAAMLIHFVSQLILLGFLYWVLDVDFGDQIPLVVITTLMGTILSLSIGACIGVLVKGNENTKSGAVTGVAMLGALFAGLMFPGLKHIIAQRFPLLMWINPVGLLSDAYYALYFYHDYSRYGCNMLILLSFSLISVVAVYSTIRRRRYDSI